jgi:phage tail-like protein
MPRTESDPYASYNFQLEIEGLQVAGFTECTGLNTETDSIDYREGTDGALSVRKLPGLSKYGNVTLKRGITQGTDLFDWRKSVVDGDIQLKNISIILLDEKRVEGVRYNLSNAWPSKWTGPEFKASANEVAVESLEIIHEGVEIA